jgi:hypothetical protein
MIKVTEEAIENFKLNILRVIEQGYQSGMPNAYMNQRIEEIIIDLRQIICVRLSVYIFMEFYE